MCIYNNILIMHIINTGGEDRILLVRVLVGSSISHPSPHFHI